MKKNIYLLFLFCCFSIIQPINGQSIKCKLWKTKDFSVMPDSLKLPSHIYCKVCSWDTKNGKKINKKGHIKAVRLTFSNMKDTCFALKSKFINFSLVKKNNKNIQHPYALLWSSEYYDKKTKSMIPELGYMTNKLKAEGYVVYIKPTEKYDLIILFKDAEIGDNVIIDNFITTEITE